MTTSIKKKAIYVRVSSHRKDTDAEKKMKSVREYLLKNGMSPEYAIMERSDGFLCYEKERPELFKLIELIEWNKIDEVFIYSVQDISVFTYGVIKKICDLHNVKITIIFNNVTLEEDKSDIRYEISRLINYIREQFKI